jgi:hypothetical protein
MIASIRRSNGQASVCHKQQLKTGISSAFFAIESTFIEVRQRLPLMEFAVSLLIIPTVTLSTRRGKGAPQRSALASPRLVIREQLRCPLATMTNRIMAPHFQTVTRPPSQPGGEAMASKQHNSTIRSHFLQ